MACSASLRDLKEQRHSRFWTPPVSTTVEGRERRVGFELEFSGLSLRDATAAVAECVGGEICEETSVEHSVVDSGLGKFKVEVDWEFLKRRARVHSDDTWPDWTGALRDVATHFVPVEVVCPPIAISELPVLLGLEKALRELGAVGTQSSPVAAFGTHVNAEVPAMDAATVHRYLRAFSLLQWWLVEEHDVDVTRRISPYIGAYPEAYLHSIHQLQDPSMEELMNHYLDHNATRNRGLDMLPLFASYDEQAVRRVVDDGRVNARPAFHYRLPDCRIDDESWNLARPWNRWCVLECLASDEDALEDLASDFILGKRSLLGVPKTDWIERVEQWYQSQ